jgi:hypothetical protein
MFLEVLSLCVSPLTQLLLPKSSTKYRALKAQEVTLGERERERERELGRCDLTPLLDLHEKEIWLLFFFHGFHSFAASSPTNGKEQ